MTLNEAERFVRNLMKRHGVESWRFLWEKERGAIGVCHPNVGIITLDPALVDDEVQLKSTAIHEIAHALTVGHGHDATWNKKVREIIAKEVWGI